MRQIKRYPNRKLYDTAEKRYVTLNDIARLIRGGNELQVLDHASGEDLTAITLTQIIFEQEKRQAGFLPRSVLTGLIQAGGERLSTLRRTLASPLDLSNHVDDEIDRRISALVARGELEEEEGAQLRQKLLSAGEPEPDMAKREEKESELERILSRYGIPKRADIEALAWQLERLDQKIDALRQGSA